MAATALINSLEKKRDLHENARKIALRTGHLKVAREHKLAAQSITAKIDKLRAADGRPPSAAHAAQSATAAKSMVITAENAGEMYQHYRKLLLHTSILNPRLRLFYLGKMRTAAMAMRRGRRLERRAIRRGGSVTKPQMQAKAAAQRKLAAHARQRRDYAAATRHTDQAERFETLSHSLPDASWEEQGGEGGGGIVRAVQRMLPRGVPGALPRGRPQDPDADPGSEDGAPMTPSEDDPGEAEMMAEGVEEPWYKRYWLPLAAAAVLGAVAFSSSKRGSGSSTKSVFAMPAASSKSVHVKVAGRPAHFTPGRPRPMP